MRNLENFSQESSELKEINWVKQQTEANLKSLQTIIEASYTSDQEVKKSKTEIEGKLNTIDLSILGAWDDSRKFIFKKGVEKNDEQGIYIEIQGQKYYKYKEGMSGFAYNSFMSHGGKGVLWYGRVLNGKFHKNIFHYYSDGIITQSDYSYNKSGRRIMDITNFGNGRSFRSYYEFNGKGEITKVIHSNPDRYEDIEYTYGKNGIKTKEVSGNHDGQFYEYKEDYEYDERGRMIKSKREGEDNDNYNRAYTYHENGNKKTEKTDRIIGITTETDYDENEEIIKEKKTYHDDKPVIEGKFDNEGELIKEEVENQESEAKESSYTGQVNVYNKQKHGSGTTTFKDKQTEGGYFENGELLIGGKKNRDNYAQQRGTVKLKEVYKVNKEKKRYQERTVESWGNTITLLDTASGYTFSTRSGAKLILPKTLGREKALAAANLINAAVGIVKQSGNELDYFEQDGNSLEADYKFSASNLRYGLQDATLITNVNEKFGVSAKELADWLNEYRKDVGI